MLRADASAYLVEEYRDLADEAEFTTDQTTSAYSVAMDMSLRQLGVAEAALSTADVAQADVLKYLALLNYYALNRFAKLLSIRVDTAAGNNAINTKDSQAFDQVTKLQTRAASELTFYGISVGGMQAYGMGRINLDILEPSTTREF
jgi:chemotaxis response regulator CheB